MPRSFRPASVFLKSAKLLCVGILLLSISPMSAQFEDGAMALGIYHLQFGQAFGGGVSLVDIDGNGMDDLTFASSGNDLVDIYLQTYEGLVPFDFPSLDIGAQQVKGVCWVDHDNDGDKDLLLTTVSNVPGEGLSGGVILFEQTTPMSFENITEVVGLAGLDIASYASSWADLDGDGILEFYLTNYESGPQGSSILFKKNDEGVYIPDPSAENLYDQQGLSFNSLFFNADDDNKIDLAVVNDRFSTINKLYLGVGDGTFSDATEAAQFDVQMEGMGIDVADYDNDGDLDLYITNALSEEGEANGGGVLMKNETQGLFSPIVDFPFDTDNGTYWGCNFVDVDFDRDLDLFMVNDTRIGGAAPIKLYLNEGDGDYIEYDGDEFDDYAGRHFGTAAGDLNGDGAVDLVVLDFQFGVSQIWLNSPQEHNHIRLSLEGTVSNRDGLGAIMEVWVDGQKRMDQASSNNSFCSQDSQQYPFGLGTAAQADSLVIKWPSGVVNVAQDVPSGTSVHLIESAEEYYIDCLPTGSIVLVSEDNSGLSQSYTLAAASGVDSISWSLDGQWLGVSDSLFIDFPAFGSYVLSAELSGPCGRLTLSDTLTIDCQAPIVEMTIEQDMLDLTAEADILDADLFYWTVDETAYFSTLLEVTLDMPGEYTVCLTAINACDSIVICETIDADCLNPVPSITAVSELLTINADLDLDFDSLIWTLDDAIISTEASLQHTVDSAGTYSLCAIYTGLCGTDTLCTHISVDCPLPTAQFDIESTMLDVLLTDNSLLSDTVTWTIDSMPIDVGEDGQYAVPQEGLYTFCLLAENTCGSSEHCQEIFLSPTALSEYNQAVHELTLSPNPSRDELRIGLATMAVDGEVDLTFVDMNGRVVLRKNARLPSDLIVVDVSRLAPGEYLIGAQQNGSLVGIARSIIID